MVDSATGVRKNDIVMNIDISTGKIDCMDIADYLANSEKIQFEQSGNRRNYVAPT